MGDREALLASVLARPGDDLPRLVYADWLDENGQGERAEFIRVQIEVARLEREKTALLNDETDWSLCESESGVAAGWCPNCGDCTCPDREERMDDPACPLHAPGSNHCRLDHLNRKADALQRRERGLWNYGLPGTWVDRMKPPFDCIQCIDEESISRETAADPILIYRRGFVSRVRGPLAAFWAEGECERCGGTGMSAAPPGDIARRWPCDDCNSPARTGEVGRVSGPTPAFAALVRREPVETVEVTDRNPTTDTTRQSGVYWHWGWSNPYDARDASDVPPEVYDRCPLSYSTEAAARAALSAALLSVGRPAPAPH